MNLSHHHDENSATPPPKKGKIGALLKILALIFVVLAIILLIYGLIPHEKFSVSDENKQGGYSGCATSILAKKGDIMIVDYEVQGGDVTFYLTYNELWKGEGQDYIIKRENTITGHLEMDIEKSGFYYLNFENNDPSQYDTFNVNLSYKVMSRYSPMYIIMGVVSLVIAFALIILGAKLKKRPIVVVEEEPYIRL